MWFYYSNGLFRGGDRELKKWARPPARQRQPRAIKLPGLRGSSPAAPSDVLIVSLAHRRGCTKRTTRPPPRAHDERSTEHVFAASIPWRNLLVCRWTAGQGARGGGGRPAAVCAAVGGPSASDSTTTTTTTSTRRRVSSCNIMLPVGLGGRAACLAAARRRPGRARQPSPPRSRPSGGPG